MLQGTKVAEQDRTDVSLGMGGWPGAHCTTKAAIGPALE